MKLLPRRKRLWTGLVFVLMGTALLAWMAARTMHARRLHAELEQVQQAIAKGQTRAARNNLIELAKSWPRQGEVLLRLGECEQALGRPDRALAAWEQVPPSDREYVKAAESRGHLLIDQGRYASAESLLLKALGETPEVNRYPLLLTLARVLRLEGRYPEVSEALTAAWVNAPDPNNVLKQLWQNDTEPVPADGWKVFLDAADAQDDRVWLGRMRHALLIGRFDDARMWLDRCLSRRPDEPVVWRACLDLAMATEDVAGFWKAAERLPVSGFQPSEIARFRSWLASRSQDRQAERRELTRLIGLQPFNVPALARLTVLAREAGDSKEAERLMRLKTEIEHAWDQIHKMVVRDVDFRSHAQELARLSAKLGRTFDENAWSLVAVNASTQGGPSQAAGASRPRNGDSGAEQSRKFCRAVAGSAMARLLANRGELHSSATGSLGDQLVNLRGVVAHPKKAIAKLREPDNTASSPLHFVDDSQAVGLQFAFDNGRTPKFYLPESLSGGVGLIDFDGDGWLDVYCAGWVIHRPRRTPFWWIGGFPSGSQTGRSPLPQPGEWDISRRHPAVRHRSPDLGTRLRSGNHRGRLR